MDAILPIAITLITGLIGGGCMVFLFLVVRRQQLAGQLRKIEEGIARAAEQRCLIEVREKQLAELSEKQRHEVTAQEKQLAELSEKQKREARAHEKQLAELSERQRDAAQARERRFLELTEKLQGRAAEVDQAERAFASRLVSYDDLRKENDICKRDLRNIEMSVRKSRLDTDHTQLHQAEIDARSCELASRYLKDNVKIIGSSINGRNYTISKQRLLDVIERCRGIGFGVSSTEETRLLEDLREEFEKAVKAELEREEQARIRAQIREEQKIQREIDKELKQTEREEAAVQAALERALADSNNAHTQEIEFLRTKLAELEARRQRAISRAQMTRSGHVYVISNLGTFGEGVFKIGMSRRLEPKERVDELGGASVPFPFDIHMMIHSEDAPALENTLHRALHKSRLNKVNPRKEFFRASLAEIAKIVEGNLGKIEYVADIAALEFRQSQTMSDEDAAYIEQVYSDEEEETEAIPDSQ